MATTFTRICVLKTCKRPRIKTEISLSSSIMAAAIAIATTNITMTMNSMAAVEEVVVEVAEAGEEEVAMIIMAVVTKGIRWPSQGIMMTTTAKEDRYRSSNE